MRIVHRFRKHKSHIALWVMLVVAVSLVLGLAAVAIATTPTLATHDLTTPGVTAATVAQELVGPGVTISNAKFTGANAACGTFTGGAGIISFAKGIILSSGDISVVKGPNDSAYAGVENGEPGDAGLNALIASTGYTTYDAAALEFDVTTKGKTVVFSYVFASEEYSEYVNTKYNDVFAFWVNGHNYATVGNPAKPVSINTINNGYNNDGKTTSHPELFINNSPQVYNTQMNGFTKKLTLVAPVKPNKPNHFKLAIADTSDARLDSDVFIKADSLLVDNKRPTPAIKSLTVKKNKVGKIQYRVKDPAPTSGQATVIIKILKARSTKVVKSLKLGLKDVNVWLKYSYKFKIAKGSYTFNIYATDVSGNKQTKIGKANLQVK